MTRSQSFRHPACRRLCAASGCLALLALLAACAGQGPAHQRLAGGGALCRARPRQLHAAWPAGGSVGAVHP